MISIGLIAATIFLFGLRARLIPILRHTELKVPEIAGSLHAGLESPTTMEGWLRGHPYLVPLAKLHATIDAAIADVASAIPGLPDWTAEDDATEEKVGWVKRFLKKVGRGIAHNIAKDDD